MKIEDYNKYIQKEDIYVIPKDIFEELFNELENFRKDYNTYRKLIENLKTLTLYDYEVDYDYEEEPIDNYYSFDMEEYINNYLEVEKLEKNEPHRTLEEYKKDVFNQLNDDEKLEWMYQMSEQLCNINEFMKERKDFLNKWNNCFLKRFLDC